MFNFGKRKAVALYRENLAAWERNLYTSTPIPHPVSYFIGGVHGSDMLLNIITQVNDETMDQFIRLWATNDSRITDALVEAWGYIKGPYDSAATIADYRNGNSTPMDKAVLRVAKIRQAEKIAKAIY